MRDERQLSVAAGDISYADHLCWLYSWKHYRLYRDFYKLEVDARIG